MRHDIGLAVLLRGGAALSWLGYVWVLSWALSSEALGTVLYALALSGLIAGLLAAGSVGRLLRDGARAAADLENTTFKAILGRALMVIIAFGAAVIAMITVAADFGLLPKLAPAWPLAPLTGAVALLTAIIGCLSAAHRARGALVRGLAVQGLGRAVLPLAVTAALAHHLQFRPDIVMGLFLGALIALVAILLPGFGRHRPVASCFRTWTCWRLVGCSEPAKPVFI